MKKYSLVKLKLDLNKLVTGPECKHETISSGIKKDSTVARYEIRLLYSTASVKFQKLSIILRNG